MHKCDICGDTFNRRTELDSHDAGHTVRPVSASPLSYLLCLPDGVTPGRYKAAEAFAGAFAELATAHPGQKFNFFPFSYAVGGHGGDTALDAILAIAQ